MTDQLGMGSWAAGLAASEEKSGAAETYESNIYQPKYDVGSKKGTKTYLHR